MCVVARKRVENCATNGANLSAFSPLMHHSHHIKRTPMKRKKKKINAENAANNNVENKLRELGVELNTDATKLNNLSRLLSALISSSPPPSLRKGRDDDLFKVDHEKDEEEKKKQSVHQKGKVECILALEKFFCKRLARGDVEQAKRDLSAKGGGGKGENTDEQRGRP